MSMKSPKAKRWMKGSKEDLKLTGLIEGGTASFDEKPGVAWLTFWVELLGFKEEQLKRVLERNVKRIAPKESVMCNVQHVTLLKL